MFLFLDTLVHDKDLLHHQLDDKTADWRIEEKAENKQVTVTRVISNEYTPDFCMKILKKF